MTQTTASTEKHRKPPRIVNRIISAVLRSPIHRALSRDLMLVTFTGRRSGNSFTTPVTYWERNGDVWFSALNRWPKNLEGGAQVELLVRGRRLTGVATPTWDQQRVLETVTDYIDERGPKQARMIGITGLEPARQPTRDELLPHVAGRALIVVTDLEPA